MADVRSLVGTLPAMVITELERLSDREQAAWLEEYERRAKSLGIAYVFWVLAGLHYAYRGKWVVQLLFWCTVGGCLVWWFVDAFRMPGIIRDANRDVAIAVLKDQRAMQR